MSACPNHSPAPLHVAFVALLPRIERHGAVYFRHVKDPSRKEELIAEAVALAWQWCIRLSERGKDVRKFPSAVAALPRRPRPPRQRPRSRPGSNAGPRRVRR
jgi:hypothetical protein